MERLTEWRTSANGFRYVVLKSRSQFAVDADRDAIRKLAEYEDAEEDGRLIVLKTKKITDKMEDKDND